MEISFKQRARIIKMIANVYPFWQDHEFNWEEGTLIITMRPGGKKENGKKVKLDIHEALQKTKDLGYL